MDQNAVTDTATAVMPDSQSIASEYEILTNDVSRLKHDSQRVRMRMSHEVRSLMAIREQLDRKTRMYDRFITEISFENDVMSRRTRTLLYTDLTILRLLKRILMSHFFRFLNWFGKWYIVDKERNDILIPVNDRYNMSINDWLWELERL